MLLVIHIENILWTDKNYYWINFNCFFFFIISKRKQLDCDCWLVELGLPFNNLIYLNFFMCNTFVNCFLGGINGEDRILLFCWSILNWILFEWRHNWILILHFCGFCNTLMRVDWNCTFSYWLNEFDSRIPISKRTYMNLIEMETPG